MRSRIKNDLYEINAFFSGSDGKGYDAFKDDLGIDIQFFTKLPLSKKQDLVKALRDQMLLMLEAEAEHMQSSANIRFEMLRLGEIAQMGLAAMALERLMDRYKVFWGEASPVEVRPVEDLP